MKTPSTKLPGLKSFHAVITPACRRGRGDQGAINETLTRLAADLVELLGNWPEDREATFHIVTTVDREGRGGDPASW